MSRNWGLSAREDHAGGTVDPLSPRHAPGAAHSQNSLADLPPGRRNLAVVDSSFLHPFEIGAGVLFFAMVVLPLICVGLIVLLFR
jgi:hypothetical protein